jgi:VanZ family protein
MKYLFLLAVVLIGYGSLYPFDFGERKPAGMLLDASPMSRGDLLQNIALFLPFGYLGMVAWSRPRRPLRFLAVVGAAAVYGAALQVVQLWLSRDPALRDALPNTIGAAAGALVGSFSLFDVRRLRPGARAAPWVLIGFWLAYRLSPFIPSFDLQEWKDSVKPLREWTPFPWANTLHDATAWLGVGCLWVAAPAGRFTARWLGALALGTLGLEVAVIENVLSPGNVAGACLGILLGALLARRPAVAGALLAAAIAVNGLEPFTARPEPRSFEWIPFGGFLQGSMLINAQSLFEKAFFYATLVWLLREAGLRLRFAAAGTALLLAGIEALQTRFSGHMPEITDPLLALFAAVFLGLADRPCPPGPPISLQSPCDAKEDV